MTFVEALGGHNGETVMEKLGGHNGDMLHQVMAGKEIDVVTNPLTALALDFNISEETDLLGKVVTDLQTGMSVNSKGKVAGTSKYVTGYTGFSSKKAEQKGNYAAFHISVGELVIGTGVTVKVNNVPLTDDGLFIMRFNDGIKSAKAIVEASVEGHDTVTKLYDFTAVVRESAN